MPAKLPATASDSPAVPGTVPDQDFAKELQAYSASFSHELRSKMERLGLLLGDSHWLSVGNYKEALIRGLLINKLPQRFEVSTGFVMSVRNKKPIKSRQIDILIWDSLEHAPIFRDREFVIIPPEACRAAIEVKGNLDHGAIKDALENLDSLSAFKVDQDVPRNSSIHRSVFAFGRGSTLDFPQSVWNSIFRHYNSASVQPMKERIDWSRNHLDCWSHPWINSVALLDEGVINCEFWNINGESQIAYSGYRTSKSDPVDTYGFLERSILLDLGLGHSRHASRYKMPGMNSILFANRAKRLEKCFFMLLPGARGAITKAGDWNPEQVKEFAKGEFKPRRPSSRKKSCA